MLKGGKKTKRKGGPSPRRPASGAAPPAGASTPAPPPLPLSPTGGLIDLLFAGIRMLLPMHALHLQGAEQGQYIHPPHVKPSHPHLSHPIPTRGCQHGILQPRVPRGKQRLVQQAVVITTNISQVNI